MRRPQERLTLHPFFTQIVAELTNAHHQRQGQPAGRPSAACFAAFQELLGPLHEESYIHVHDVREQAYGYGGLTQEHRYIQQRLAAAG